MSTATYFHPKQKERHGRQCTDDRHARQNAHNRDGAKRHRNAEKHVVRRPFDTHSSARVDTKQSLIEAMEPGKTVCTSVEPSEVKAPDLGNAVVLIGVAAISVNSNGKPNSFRVRFAGVYENQSSTWRMVTWQLAKLPD